MRRLIHAVALILGIGVGLLVGAAAGGRPIPPTDLPEAAGVAVPTVTVATMAPTTAPSTAPDPVTTSEPPVPPLYLVWSSGGLEPELTQGLAELDAPSSTVLGDLVLIDAGSAGWSFPLDAIAIDPIRHSAVVGDDEVTALSVGTVLLSDASSELRRVGAGEDLSVDGLNFTVAAVVADDSLGGAEIAFHVDDPNSGVVTSRYVLLRAGGDRAVLEATVRAMHPGASPLRIRAEGESPWLRHGDAVLPQAFIKLALGEFAIRNLGDGEFEIEAAWLEENVVTAEVPLLGSVTCHRVVLEMLTGAMAELEAAGLAHLVDRAGFAGCFEPRLIRSSNGRPTLPSRHAWGAAVDLNAPTNQVGTAGTQDPRLVEVMARWGFTWGGEWLVADPMHFEFLVDRSGA